MSLVNEVIAKMQISTGTVVTFHNRKRIEMTFPELEKLVRRAACYLKGLNLGCTDVVAIIGKNDLEWIIADLACIHLGIKLLPLEPSSSLSHYQSKQLHISAIMASEHFLADIKPAGNHGLPCIPLAALLSAEDPQNDEIVTHQYSPVEVLSYKSTSGSTGLPKVIGHSVASINNSLESIQQLFCHKQQDRILVFLPLNLLQQRYWLYSAILYDHTVIIVPKEMVFVAIKQEKPTIIMGVPYIYETIKENFEAMLQKEGSLLREYKSFISRETKTEGRFVPFNEYLGGNINYLWTGSAPISRSSLAFFFEMGIPLYQGYGMNETCIIAKNYGGNNKIGSVGKLFPGIDLRFDQHQQILVKNIHLVCSAYTISSPLDQLTTFREDGYIATGDCGYMDEDGFLFITGRIKDMIVLSSSKKVFPRSIEEKIEKSEDIAHCVVYGDDRPYLVAMLIPNTADATKERMHEIINGFNEQAKEEEKIYSFFISNEKFTEENSRLTNQGKIKRQAVYQQFRDHFNSLYK
ncbi:MAG: AMP-binding protein [Ginsengibacter sp.]